MLINFLSVSEKCCNLLAERIREDSASVISKSKPAGQQEAPDLLSGTV